MTRRAQDRIPTELVARRGNRPEPTTGEFHAPEHARLVGQVLCERYRIESVLAGGAMGHVYLATQLPFERTVAIKVLYCEGRDQEDGRFRKRFEREASIAAQLAHPNIVTIIDYGETSDGDVFMAMEYVEGKPLYRVLQEEGAFPARRALNIAIQIARALRRAHRMGVVHRDLKPANIMLRTEDDGLDFVKILDFGLVKIFAPDTGPTPEGIDEEHLTSVGAMMGTPGYMAPEQAIGDRVDGRADLYSLAVILFQMLTGRLPFSGDTIVDLITAQVMQPPPFVKEVEPDVECPDELEAIIHRSLNKSRSARYQSAEELLLAFKSVWRLETDHSFGTEASLPPFLPLPEHETVKHPALGHSSVLDLEEDALPPVPLERSTFAYDAAPGPTSEMPGAYADKMSEIARRATAEAREILATDPGAGSASTTRSDRWRVVAVVALGLLITVAGVGAFFSSRSSLRARVGGIVDLPDPAATKPASAGPAESKPTPAVPATPVTKAPPTEPAPTVELEPAAPGAKTPRPDPAPTVEPEREPAVPLAKTPRRNPAPTVEPEPAPAPGAAPPESYKDNPY